MQLTDTGLENYFELIGDELNVEEVVGGKLKAELDTEMTPRLLAKGQMRDLVRKIQEERKKLGTKLDEKVDVTLPDWPKEFESEIKKRALVTSIKKGAFEVVRHK